LIFLMEEHRVLYEVRTEKYTYICVCTHNVN